MATAYVGNMMRQELTYWAPGAADGFGGVGFAAPVTLRGRWQDREELFRVGGQATMSKAIAYVDRTLAVNGFLALGTWLDDADPRGVAVAREIRAAKVSPALRADRELNKVWM